jgi:hypothetical protein
MAIPAASTARDGAGNRSGLAASIILPHDGVGGTAEAEIAQRGFAENGVGDAMVAITTRIGMVFGSRWPNSRRRADRPSTGWPA